MTLEEYAKRHPYTYTDRDRRISELEAQIWEDDRNDPVWVRAQNREHNEPIWREIRRLREGGEVI